MNIIDALEKTGKAVRECWDKPTELDAVYNYQGILVQGPVGKEVNYLIIVKVDWIPYYSPKTKCWACKEAGSKGDPYYRHLRKPVPEGHCTCKESGE